MSDVLLEQFPICCAQAGTVQGLAPRDFILAGDCWVPGSLHIPLEQLAHALQAPASQFEESYGHPQPLRAHGWVVLVSRREVRAAWAAQLAHDAGFRMSLILRQVCACVTVHV